VPSGVRSTADGGSPSEENRTMTPRTRVGAPPLAARNAVLCLISAGSARARSVHRDRLPV